MACGVSRAEDTDAIASPMACDAGAIRAEAPGDFTSASPGAVKATGAK